MIWQLWPPYIATNGMGFRLGWLNRGFRFFWSLPRRWFGRRNLFYIGSRNKHGARGWGLEKWSTIRQPDRSGEMYEASKLCEHCSRGLRRSESPQLVADRRQVPCICKQPDIHTCQQHDATAYPQSAPCNQAAIYGIPCEAGGDWITEVGILPGEEYERRTATAG